MDVSVSPKGRSCVVMPRGGSPVADRINYLGFRHDVAGSIPTRAWIALSPKGKDIFRRIEEVETSKKRPTNLKRLLTSPKLRVTTEGGKGIRIVFGSKTHVLDGTDWKAIQLISGGPLNCTNAYAKLRIGLSNPGSP